MNNRKNKFYNKQFDIGTMYASERHTCDTIYTSCDKKYKNIIQTVFTNIFRKITMTTLWQTTQKGTHVSFLLHKYYELSATNANKKLSSLRNATGLWG